MSATRRTEIRRGSLRTKFIKPTYIDVPITPRGLDRAFRSARASVVQSHALDPAFRFHDLRHYYASLLIASGADVKIVQARLRHKSAQTTLDTYGHLWPDSDDSTRAAVGSILAAKKNRLELRTFLRTGGDSR